jgi:hypothetical protein
VDTDACLATVYWSVRLDIFAVARRRKTHIAQKRDAGNPLADSNVESAMIADRLMGAYQCICPPCATIPRAYTLVAFHTPGQLISLPHIRTPRRDHTVFRREFGFPGCNLSPPWCLPLQGFEWSSRVKDVLSGSDGSKMSRVLIARLENRGRYCVRIRG